MNKTLERFLKYENEKKLFERQYNGVYYWQYIRNSISLVLLKMDCENSKASKLKKRNWLIKIGNLLKDYANNINYFIHLKQCDIMYLDQLSSRYVDGKWVDPYFDFFELEKIYLVQRCFYMRRENVENIVSRGSFLPELRGGCLFDIKKKFPIFFRDRNEDKFIEEFVESIRNEFQVNVNVSLIKDRIRDIAYSYKAHHNYYKNIIKKIRPKVIVVVCHYDSRLYPLYSVAHKAEIPVIELEHGLICNHEAYNYGDTTDIGKSLPDYLLTYGEFWHDYIRLPACMKAVAIGNPFLENRAEKYKDIEPDEKKIVFYSGVPMGHELAKFVVEFYQRYKDLGYSLYYKLHPGEFSDWKERYDKLLGYPGIKILRNEMDLYELLSGAKHHVTIGSTVLFESTIFRVKRYVLMNESYVHCMQPLIDAGFADVFQTVDEFRLLLNENTTNQLNISNQMWKKNAKKNVQYFFEKLMDRSIQ